MEKCENANVFAFCLTYYFGKCELGQFVLKCIEPIEQQSWPWFHSVMPQLKAISDFMFLN